MCLLLQVSAAPRAPRACLDHAGLPLVSPVLSACRLLHAGSLIAYVPLAFRIPYVRMKNMNYYRITRIISVSMTVRLQIYYKYTVSLQLEQFPFVLCVTQRQTLNVNSNFEYGFTLEGKVFQTVPCGILNQKPYCVSLKYIL